MWNYSLHISARLFNSQLAHCAALQATGLHHVLHSCSLTCCLMRLLLESPRTSPSSLRCPPARSLAVWRLVWWRPASWPPTSWSREGLLSQGRGGGLPTPRPWPLTPGCPVQEPHRFGSPAHLTVCRCSTLIPEMCGNAQDFHPLSFCLSSWSKTCSPCTHVAAPDWSDQKERRCPPVSLGGRGWLAQTFLIFSGHSRLASPTLAVLK